MRSPLFLLLASLLLVSCAPIQPGTGTGTSSSSFFEDRSEGSSASSSSGALTSMYTGYGYSIRYPDGWTVKTKDALITENYEANGTSFNAPLETGSKLREAKMHVAVQDSCPGSIMIMSSGEQIDGALFITRSWDGAAAGNRYEGKTWAGTIDGKCYLLTAYLHSCNLGPDCGPMYTKEWDKAAYMKTFEEIVKTFRLQP